MKRKNMTKGRQKDYLLKKEKITNMIVKLKKLEKMKKVKRKNMSLKKEEKRNILMFSMKIKLMYMINMVRELII